MCYPRVVKTLTQEPPKVTQRLNGMEKSDNAENAATAADLANRVEALERWKGGEGEERFGRLETAASVAKKEQSEIKKRVADLEKRQNKALSALEILAKYNRSRVAGANYFKSIFGQAKEGILRVDFSQQVAQCEYSRTGSINAEMLGRRIGQRIRVLSSAVKASGKAFARIQLDLRPTLRAEAVRAIVNRRAEFKGEFGISIPPAREYNIDMTLAEWKATGLIERFDISKKGQYVVTVAGGGGFRWLVNCPKELVKIPESELKIEVLKKVSDWSKYFTVDRLVLEIPLALRPRKEGELSVPRSENLNGPMANFNNGGATGANQRLQTNQAAQLNGNNHIQHGLSASRNNVQFGNVGDQAGAQYPGNFNANTHNGGNFSQSNDNGWGGGSAVFGEGANNFRQNAAVFGGTSIFSSG